MFAENLHSTTDSLPPSDALLLILIVLKFSWLKKKYFASETKARKLKFLQYNVIRLRTGVRVHLCLDVLGTGRVTWICHNHRRCRVLVKKHVHIPYKVLNDNSLHVDL